MTKKIFFILFFAAITCVNISWSQPFITRWDLTNLPAWSQDISFGVTTTGTVSYTWETVPAGTSGSGTFSGNYVTISGLPANSIIRLSIDTTNFRAIKVFLGFIPHRLIDIEQWGAVNWNSMQSAFKECTQLQVSATDIPNLSGVSSCKEMFKSCTALNSPSNIGSWNMSTMTDLSEMFFMANAFNQNVSNWDVSAVTNFSYLFASTPFNQDINTWNTLSATNFTCMFQNNTAFNQPLNNWNTQNVNSMAGMFMNTTSFNQPLNNWNTLNVNSMASMFAGATAFNQPLNNWNTLNVNSMASMFANNITFNQPLNNWNTQNVTNLSNMFAGANSFNQPLNNWNTQNVTNMSNMFANATAFNQPLNNWNTQNVTNMSNMFAGATTFNQPLNNWNTQNVINMSSLFRDASSFNQDLSLWNTVSVTNSSNMFRDAISFNQNLQNWNTSNIIQMSNMFKNATSFNYPLNTWNMNSSVNINGIFDSCGMSCLNYSATLIGWASMPAIPQGKNLGAAALFYQANAIPARNYLINIKSWTMNGDSLSNVSCCTPQILPINQTSCDQYLFNGNLYTQSGIYYDTFLSASTCDSILMLNLTILNSSPSYIMTETACKNYNFNGQSISNSGLYYDTLLNVLGCDSIIELNLTIIQPNTTVFQSGATLYSYANNGSQVQWIRCNPYQILPGDTSLIYVASTVGDYAVVVNTNGCIDTSDCYTVMTVNSIDYHPDWSLSIYPNPTTDYLHLQAPNSNDNYHVCIFNTLSQKIHEQSISSGSSSTIDMRSFANGVYFLKVSTSQGVKTYSVSKK